MKFHDRIDERKAKADARRLAMPLQAHEATAYAVAVGFRDARA